MRAASIEHGKIQIVTRVFTYADLINFIESFFFSHELN